MLVGVKGKKEMIFMPLQSLGMARQGNTGPHLTSPPMGGSIIEPRHSQFFEQWKHFQRELYVH
jgi:hypothetical protein